MAHNPTHPPTRPRCPDVPWCTNTPAEHADAHLADLDTLFAGSRTTGIILWRGVGDPDPASTRVRFQYGPDAETMRTGPRCLDITVPVAVELADALEIVPLQQLPDLWAALRRAGGLLAQEITPGAPPPEPPEETTVDNEYELCTWCGKPPTATRIVVLGPGVAICEHCHAYVGTIIEHARRSR
ncbi:hypothetical protein [Acrocarpospora sp. B8E8]|uniref:hypothetical protein n=1 Tax=Acrocarpospora sp. B8E8 TaxID=3153572 RepID=UPI00325C3D19